MSETVSVVIVTYNNATEIDGCLASILGQPEARQILVVDNASTDGTVAVLERIAASEPRIRVLHNAMNLGFGSACNQALRLCSEPLVLLLNPDAAALPGALEALARGFAEHPGAGILGLKVYDWDGTTVQLSCRAFPGFGTALAHRYSLLTRLWPRNPWSSRYLSSSFDHDRVAAFDWVSGCAMGLRRASLEKIGLFDEIFFMYCEDVDLCRRARNAGLDVLYLPTAQVRHRIGGSSRSVPRLTIVERHRSMWLYYKKHLRGGRILDALTWSGIQARCAWQLLKNR